jgi:DNA modification methylase
LKNFDTIVCEDSTKIGKIIPPNSVDLSIVVPPYISLKDYYSTIQKSSKKFHKSTEESITSTYLNFIEDFLKGIANVTRPGGICCLILSNEIDPETDFIIPTAQATIVKIMNPSDTTPNWQIDGQIIWVKSPREKVEPVNDTADTSSITFSETPYSMIYVLMKKGKNAESISILDRLWELRLSDDKKTEMSDFVWYIQPSSDKGYKDHIPKELAIRLVMLFSLENELVLDPFARHGVTAIVSKTLQRHFLCIEKNSSKVEKAKQRLTSIE